VSSALGVHEFTHDISEGAVTQLAEEAWGSPSVIHTFFNVLQSYITGKTQLARGSPSVIHTFFNVLQSYIPIISGP